MTDSITTALTTAGALQSRLLKHEGELKRRLVSKAVQPTQASNETEAVQVLK
jgi:hypothetical protein